MNKRTSHPIENLASAFRRAGAHRLDMRDLELKLGRALTALERGAYHIARDSRTHKEESSKAHTARYARIQEWGGIKGNNLERIDKNRHFFTDSERASTAKPTRKIGLDSTPHAPISDKLAEFQMLGLRNHRRPAEMLTERFIRDSASPIQVKKPEEWDSKK